MLVSSLLDFFYPEYRLSWFDSGPSSPNKTGAFIALLMIAAIWPALRFRLGFYVSLISIFVLAVFLIQTESRGGIVALIGGFICILVSLLFKSVTNFTVIRSSIWCGAKGYVLRAALVVASLVLLLGYATTLGVSDRFAGLARGDDESTNVRLELYAAGIKMLDAAPSGWGLEQSGEVYAQWYQSIGDNRTYLSLVNSHLSWMAELGIMFRFFYIFLWILAFAICLPLPYSPLRCIAFSSLLVLVISGCFSSVLSLYFLWYLPGFLTLLCLIERLLNKRFSLILWVGISSIMALTIVFFIQFMSSITNHSPKVSFDGSKVTLGENSKILIIEPDHEVLGVKYGHVIRQYLDQLKAISVMPKYGYGDKIPSSYDVVVCSGRMPKVDLEGFTGHILLFNPDLEVGSKTIQLLQHHHVTIVLGALGDWRRQKFWDDLSSENATWQTIFIDESKDYISKWPTYLFHEADVPPYMHKRAH